MLNLGVELQGICILLKVHHCKVQHFKIRVFSDHVFSTYSKVRNQIQLSEMSLASENLVQERDLSSNYITVNQKEKSEFSTGKCS